MFAPLDELESEIAELAGHLAAGNARLLALLGEFDRRGGWQGFNSCAAWLSWRCGLSPVTAREQVRVARALERLPLIAAAFARGELSYSKVRALIRVATPETESLLMDWAPRATAAQLERIARGYRRMQAVQDPAVMHRRRRLSAFFDEDGYLVIDARLEPEYGAIFLRALEEAATLLDDSAESSLDDDPFDLDASPPPARKRADALRVMAEHFLNGDRHTADPERALIVVHTDSLSPGPGDRCELQGGAPIAAKTLQRLACDASVVRVLDGDHGAPLSIGRKTRVVPRSISRALRFRDRGCRFPGCTAIRVDAHHIEHWAHGGPTSLANLVLLCRHHHRLIHEQGYTIGNDLTFHRPDGRAIANPSIPVARDGVGLINRHRAAGPHITPHTTRTRDYARGADYSAAVGALLTLNAPP